MANLRANNLTGTGGRNALDGSVFFSDTNDRLSVPNSADVRLGSDDFTIEAWIRSENPGDWTTVIGMWDSSATRRTYALQRKKSDSKLYLYVSADGGNTVSATATQYAYGGNVALGEWHHVAGVRDGNTIRAYLNGVEVGNASFTATILNNTTDALFIGDTEVTAGGEAFNGYMSNVRLIKGTCLYPSGTTFTPPTSKLTAVDGTVLLCCQDSDDPTQEATGKTITGYGKLAAGQPKATKSLPSVGVDEGVVFDGDTKVNSQGYMYFPTGDTAQRGRGRGLFMGGYTPTPTGTNLNSISYIDISSTGHDKDFGDLTLARYASGAFSSSTRAILGGGRTPSRQDRIDYVTIAQTGNAIDFGNLHTANAYNQGTSNETRGLFLGGNTPTYITQIDYVTIATTGDAADFGDLTDARSGGPGVSSPTRAICMGGHDGSAYVDVIDYVTIATTGNATDFGDIISAKAFGGGVSNGVRGLIGGGGKSPSGDTDDMEYVTIASTGDAIDFGDLVYSREHVGAVSNRIRGVWMGGVTPNYQTDIQYAIIATTGSAENWGDLYVADSIQIPKGYISGASDSHGGLS